MEEEIWKSATGYEMSYEVSNFGNVRSVDRFVNNKNGIPNSIRKGRRLKPFKTSTGYLRLALKINGRGENHFVHRLVAEAFVPNPNNYPCINHKDENPANNRADNLEWCSHKYNNDYGGRKSKVFKSRETNQKGFKGVRQYSLDGQFLHEYASAYHAARALKMCVPNIGKCCRMNSSKYHAHGFLWRFSEYENADKIEPYHGAYLVPRNKYGKNRKEKA